MKKIEYGSKDLYVCSFDMSKMVGRKYRIVRAICIKDSGLYRTVLNDIVYPGIDITSVDKLEDFGEWTCFRFDIEKYPTLSISQIAELEHMFNNSQLFFEEGNTCD